MSETRRDHLNRKLRFGESQREDGRYRYTYLDAFGKKHDIYSWRLDAGDPYPTNKRRDLSLREKEMQVAKDTYCSNQAKAGMNPKTLQYLIGHSEIGVTLDVYTHLGLEDAAAELHRMEELQNARQEMNRTKDEAV